MGLKRKMRHELGISAGQEAVAVAKEQAEAKAFLRSGLQAAASQWKKSC